MPLLVYCAIPGCKKLVSRLGDVCMEHKNMELDYLDPDDYPTCNCQVYGCACEAPVEQEGDICRNCRHGYHVENLG